MSQQIVKFDVNSAISSENSSGVKEEFQDEYYLEDKIFISETTITDTVNISSSEPNGYIGDDEIKKYETLSVDHIKTDFSSSEVNNVKIEDVFCPSDMQIEFCNELLFCNHCHEGYEDYCTKCRVLVHILNQSPSHNTCTRIRELPKYMLETRESIGCLGIFSLNVIPEDVRFGPFTGLNSKEVSLKIKGGRFVVSDDKSEHLNWMQYINPARNIYEQNLFPLQFEDKLYYCSTRRIQKGEELLVYFGEKYEDNLRKNVEMDFIPIIKEDVTNVFACTFCCLGFNSKEYLAEHKVVTHSEANKILSVEDLAQCPFCRIYVERQEYFEHHMAYCCETNDRSCALSSAELHKQEIEGRSFLRSNAKRRKRGIYKCTQCKFRTMYHVHFRHHSNEHHRVKIYRCGICHRRYKTKKSLTTHVKKHADNKGRDVQKYSTCDYFKKRSAHLHDGEKQCVKTIHLKGSDYKCPECEYTTNNKSRLKLHVKTKHLREYDYKCAECEYKTNTKPYLKLHIKTKHLKQMDYKCAECQYKTNYRPSLKAHVKTKHLKEHDYKCAECEYKTNNKSRLKLHVKTKHLKEYDYKCTECEFKTNRKPHLKLHIKTKHLKQIDDYKCAECQYKTNYRPSFEIHVKTKHLKEHDYKCTECEYKTNNKTRLKQHVKTRHLKEYDYKCTECEFKTNRKPHLTLHIKTKHLKQIDYKNAECPYKTNYKPSFEAHVKTKHLKEHDYKCTECEFKTNNKPHLKAHIKTRHLKEYDYKCAECEYKTNRKLDIEKHIKKVHFKGSRL